MNLAGLKTIADLLFPLPRSCVVCGRATEPAEMALCESCVNHLRRPFERAVALCEVCGRPDERLWRAQGTCNCPECALAPRSFRTVHPGSIYREPVKAIIRDFKYARRPDLCHALIRPMARALQGLHYDVFVPVPIHSSRLAARGYNQARLLAKELSQGMGGVLLDALAKRRQPKAQALLNRPSRLTSLEGAFLAGRNVERALRGASVLLVDDVFTTGATAHFCARELLRIGAGSVDVAVAAIAVVNTPGVEKNSAKLYLRRLR